MPNINFQNFLIYVMCYDEVMLQLQCFAIDHDMDKQHGCACTFVQYVFNEECNASVSSN